MLYLRLLSVVYKDETPLWQYRLLGWAVIALIIGLPILVIRSLRKTARNAADVNAIYAGITNIRPPGAAPLPGEVRLTFHTYSGLLIYTIQRKHDLILPADQAKILLDRMHKHNLTRGLLAFLPFFIVPLSFLEYRAQSKKIAAALQHGFPIN